MIGATFREKLDFVWDGTTTYAHGPPTLSTRRYIVKNLGLGDVSWGVFDRLENRFLLNEEIFEMSLVDLSSQMGVA